MENKHTPGKWVTKESMVYSETGNGKTIANVDTEANARLIAAAPELLEACKNVAKWHRENDSGEGELFGLDFITTCISAIAKAEGETLKF